MANELILNVKHENDDNEYYIENNGIYYRNDLLIARIVYKCFNCNHIFDTIIESLNHYKHFHQNIHSINNNNNNNKSIDIFVVEKNDLNEEINNKNKFLELNQNSVKRKKINFENKKLNKNSFKSEDNALRRRQRLKKRVIDLNIKCLNNGCDNRLDSQKTRKFCDQCFDHLLETNEKTEEKEEKLFKLCDKSLTSKKSFISDRNSHRLRFVCAFNHCNKRFATKDEQNDHLRSHSSEEEVIRYTCNICGKYRNSIQRFKVHMKLHSNPIECETIGCNKKFATSHEMRAHQKCHFNKEKRFECKTCGKTYSRERKLKEHLLLHSDPKLCDFPNCGKLFATNTILKVHQLTHSSEANHVCDWPGCEFRAKQKGSLIAHRLRHQNERPFRCQWTGCEQCFRTNDSLESHIALQHKNERNFICDFPGCGKSFATNRYLIKHKSGHSAQKKVSCDWPNCERKFLHNYQLKKHLCVHTGERPYRCDWPDCEARFGLPVTLDTHKKLVHKCNYIKRSRWDKKNK